MPKFKVVNDTNIEGVAHAAGSEIELTEEVAAPLVERGELTASDAATGEEGASTDASSDAGEDSADSNGAGAAA